MTRLWPILAFVVACGGGSEPASTQETTNGTNDSWSETSGSENGDERGMAVVTDAPPPPPPAAMTRELEFAMGRYARRLAVTVGVNAYRPPINPLNFAVSDAQHVALQLSAMGFEVVASLENAEATRESILALLNRTLAERVGPNDLVVVYFAGHGTTVGEMGYVLPSDATPAVERTAVSVQELKEAALRWENRHTMFLIDACFSGSMFRRPFRSADTNPLSYWQSISEQRLVEILTAGSENETVQEAGGWGLFTRTIVAALAGHGDLNRDGVVSGMELAIFAYEIVTRQTNQTQHPQWGAAEGAGTVLFWDARRVPAPDERLTRRLSLPEQAETLARVHDLLDRGEHREAEQLLRRTMLQTRHPVLNLTLAETYLLADPRGNGNLVQQELDNADNATLDDSARGVLIELRARLERVRRGRI